MKEKEKELTKIETEILLDYAPERKESVKNALDVPE